jgi:hypothetical protein
MVAAQLAQLMPVSPNSTRAVGTAKPAPRICAMICERRASLGSKVTAAWSFAKFTLASDTPGSFFRTRSTVAAQLAQVIPATGIWRVWMDIGSSVKCEG